MLSKGKKLQEDHKRKIGNSNRGKRNKAFCDAVSKGMKGLKQSAETIEKRRLAQTGLKRTKEFCERLKTVNAMSIKVVDSQGNVYMSFSEANRATGIPAKKISRLSKNLQQGWAHYTSS